MRKRRHSCKEDNQIVHIKRRKVALDLTRNPERNRSNMRRRKKRGRKKKLIIAPFSIKKVPKDFFTKKWEILEKSVRCIFSETEGNVGLESLYKSVENLERNGCGEELFQNLFKLCKEFCVGEYQKIRSCSDLISEEYLSNVRNAWICFVRRVKITRTIFLYLDRKYVSKLKVKSVWNLFIGQFRDHVIQQSGVQDKIVTFVLDRIFNDRNGEIVNRTLLKEILKMFQDLEIYISVFEEEFLKSTQLYFLRTGQYEFSNCNTSEYLRYVSTILQNEQDRIRNYLSTTSFKPLIKIVHSCLVKRNAESILENGFKNLVQKHNLGDLQLLYTFFSQTGDIEKVRSSFESFAYNSGRVIIQDRGNEKNMIVLLLDLRKRFDELIARSFGGNNSFSQSVRVSFTKFINERKNAPAMLIAKFIHSLLSKDSRMFSDGEVEEKLEDALKLFKFVESKDIFEEFYKQMFASRLLLKNSSSMDAEKFMIMKLKTECGTTFTSKLEGMLKDMDVSKNYMKEFSRKKGDGCAEFNATIIKTGSWPTYNSFKIIYPDSIQKMQKCYNEFYERKHSGRKLSWVTLLETCHVQGRFESEDKTFICSGLQCVVLLVFNRLDENVGVGNLSFKEIMTCCGVEDFDFLKRTLISLTTKKTKVLLSKHGTSSGFVDRIFKVNSKFHHKLKRIKINFPQKKETQISDESIEEKALFSRDFVIDCAIVRIMKARKTLEHAILVSETMKQVLRKFSPSVPSIKKRIESLIDKEYIERSLKDNRIYNYRA